MNILTNFKFIIKNIQKPHTISELEINNSFVIGFFFIESIGSIFMTGQLSLYDKHGFFENINFTGKEIITVVIQQELQGQDKNKTVLKSIDFEIFNVTTHELRLNNMRINLELVEKGASLFYGTNYNKAYKNKKVSDIVTDVLKTQLKITDRTEYEIEPTYDVLENFIIPFWKPINTISYLLNISRRVINPNEGGFLFFSTCGDDTRKKPIKRFISFSKLMEEKGDYKKDEDIDYSFKNSSINPMYINNIKDASDLDYNNRGIFKDGIGGKRFFSIDYNIDKNIIEEKQKYSEFFKKTKILNKYSLFDKTIDNVNDDVELFGGPSYLIKAVQDGAFRKLLNLHTKREIILKGSLLRYAGQVIWIEQTSDNINSAYHKHDSGYWLITGITHTFESGYYHHKVHIIKDSYNSTNLTNMLVK